LSHGSSTTLSLPDPYISINAGALLFWGIIEDAPMARLHLASRWSLAW